MTMYKSLVFALVLIAAPPFSTQAFAGNPDTPTYLAYAAEPVQKIYSDALLGFALEWKCQFLEQSARDIYEQRLSTTQNEFEGYVLLQGMAKNPLEAVEYVKAMTMAAIRFAAAQPCDPGAKEEVSKGLQRLKDFDEEMRKDLKPLKPND
ncbi:hypothetical protein LYSHEL_21630 [Lysobacter helvus]|uniref:Uncharacterized protein n=2 Tax=Lysobacteraceae TaxID=32033 RepID=A0ABM7Q6Z3_9GAMM|nr:MULTISPECIES: hypothetical protein [Lysobacter]BCT93140.1 hypothetical protein LYSCAS_21640 [Lysobacter caseinilyticus]BCT96292.1 hypothetical protein LYSHEL_21630 [Lysobacter helvus]